MRNALLVAIALVQLTGCEGSEGSGDGGLPDGWSGLGSGGAGVTTGVSEAQIRDVIDLTCRRARTCCMREGFDPVLLADCETDLRSAGPYTLLASAQVRVLEPDFTNCLSLSRSMVDSCDLSAATMLPAECGRVLEGTVAPGGPCVDAIECSSDGQPVLCLRAVGIAEDEPGVCRVLARGREGEGCLLSASEDLRRINYRTSDSEVATELRYCHHADGLQCDFASGSCVAFLSEGAACSGRDACAPELYCDGTCKRRKPAGSPCSESLECGPELLLCRDGACAVLTYGDTDICEGDLD